MRAVAAIPAVGLLAGTALGLLAPDIPPWIGSSLLVVAIVCSLAAWRTRQTSAIGAAVAVGFLAGGALLSSDSWRKAWHPALRVAFDEIARAERAQAAVERRVLPEDDEAFAIVEGALRTDGALTASGASLSVAVDTICSAALSGPRTTISGAALSGLRTAEPVTCRPATGGVLATVVGSLSAERVDLWRAGRRVRLSIRLRRPSRYLDPGVPDYERALARRETILVGTVKSAGLVDVVSRGSVLEESTGAIRAFSRRVIAEAVGRWSARSAAIVAAIVIGDRAGLDDDVQRTLQEAGTYHVIAISGGNIAILAGLMLGAFRFAGLLGRTAMLAAIAMLAAYGYFVGGGASVDRATLMAAVYFTGRAIDQRSPPLNTLSVVAAVLAAASPLSIADPAFVLTFGATLAILLVMPLVPATTGVVRSLIAMLAASVAAEAMLFPVSAVVFARVTFAGLALNFLAIPLMAVAQVAGMTVVPAAVVSSRAAAALGFVAHCGAGGLIRSAELVHAAPLLAYRVAPPGWPSIALYYAALVIAWTMWRRRIIRWCAVAVALAAALWILAQPWTLLTARGDGRLHVTFIDVGQGDAAFVRFPRGATLLVDAGGLAFGSGFDIGDRVVAPVLREAGVRRLDAMALTHGDPDHIGGAAAIVREFRPREVWEGIPVPRSEPLTALKDAARELGLTWRNVRASDRFRLNDVDVVVRHPPPADWERQRVRNDDSIVLDFRWRDVSVLFTGDIGQSVERALVLLPEPRLRIVKVAHHGSLTSSGVDFVRALAPQVAVVSAGRANHFGHPAPEVLERYRDVGAEIFRTDRDGAMMVDSDGFSLHVRSYSGRTAIR